MLSLTPLLRVRSLSKSYRRGLYGHETTHTVLRNLNLDVYTNECVAIVGPRGTGKTTLLYCLSEMLPPTSGTIQWRLMGRSGKPDIAHVSEQGMCYGFLTVTETLEYYITESDLSSEDRARRIAQILVRVGLTDMRHTRVCDLPATSLSLLRLAQALIGGPQVMLLDELISSIPLSCITHVRSIFQSCTNSGMTIIMTTFNHQVATALASRVIPIHTDPKHAGSVIPPHPLQSRIELPVS